MMHRPTRRPYDAHRTSRLSSGSRWAILNHRASDVGSVAINDRTLSRVTRPYEGSARGLTLPRRVTLDRAV